MNPTIYDYDAEIEEDDRDFIAEMFGGMQYDDRYGDADRIDSSVDGTAPAGYSSDFIRESMKKKRGAPGS